MKVIVNFLLFDHYRVYFDKIPPYWLRISWWIQCHRPHYGCKQTCSYSNLSLHNLIFVVVFFINKLNIIEIWCMIIFIISWLLIFIFVLNDCNIVLIIGECIRFSMCVWKTFKRQILTIKVGDHGWYCMSALHRKDKLGWHTLRRHNCVYSLTCGIIHFLLSMLMCLITDFKGKYNWGKWYILWGMLTSY